MLLGAVIMAGVAALQMMLEQEGGSTGPAAPPVDTRAESPGVSGAPAAETRAAKAESAIKSPSASPAKLPFDYYVLALSWSPSFCRERPDADQCGKGRRFLLHGLWPNLEDGWRSDCDTRYRRPTQALLAKYAPLSAGSSLLDYQWRKHGTCSGLSPEAYFEASARAYKSIVQPEVLMKVEDDLDVSPDVIEAAFMEANPQLGKDGVTVRCDAGRLSEIRICLTPDLKPRDCAPRTARDCRSRSIELPAPR